LATFILLLYIDWYLIPVLFMKGDQCYYHFHDPPFLIDMFFLDMSGHVEPPFNMINFLSLLIFTGCSSFLILRMINLKMKSN
jgi:hypothetical protein